MKLQEICCVGLKMSLPFLKTLCGIAMGLQGLPWLCYPQRNGWGGAGEMPHGLLNRIGRKLEVSGQTKEL